ncbi:serine/threonine-protein kinase [Streptomyces sp. WI03-4A]|uniref:serine/threonine protein kinase n=1 Tax=Streptomyces sp. WI03-4A TaxID=3028706 RepID=UPI0029AE1EA2|nr:serine/threonine-protein kinase [Streptomyces sp. WI03-4A]MDX2595292.1 serine/threonine-protein kinase [Streptomyces sp. WI03-4A]
MPVRDLAEVQLDRQQCALLVTIGTQQAKDPAGRWPLWEWVEHRAASLGLENPRALLNSLPRIGTPADSFGLSYGFTTALPRSFVDDTRVALTVAAAWALDEARSDLGDPFLQVMHHMIALWRDTPRSPNEVTRIALTSENLQAAFPNLRARTISLIPEIFANEPFLSASRSRQSDDSWAMEIPRQVMQYKDVKTLHDYVRAVSHHVNDVVEADRSLYVGVPTPVPFPFTAFESESMPVPVNGGERAPAQFEAPTTTVAFPGEAIESSAYLARLLLWLDAQAQQHPGEYSDVTRFVEELGLEEEDPTVLALQLEQRGLVNIARNLAGIPDVYLSDEGRVTVHKLKKLQGDRAARLRYTMGAFLQWLFDTAGDQAPTNPVSFLTTPGSSFAGADVSAVDLDQALAYLAERSFIEHIDTDPITVAITRAGVGWALSGERVQGRASAAGADTVGTIARPTSGSLTHQARQQQDRGDAPHQTTGMDPQLSAATQDRYEQVRSQASGDPKAYRRDKDPHPESNQADVFKATHKNTDVTVALKQLHGRYPREQKIARMKREIEAGKALSGHPHAMPILDHGNEHTWFVMPWADSTAADHKEVLKDPEQLRVLVDALTSVLHAAHKLGWIHRDIKPPNILCLSGRWVLADWGAVRRPPGQTTKIDRTAIGIGTEGFSAPEVLAGQDRPQACGDVYSVGRVIAWALTGDMPQPNKQLLPAPGPWRNIVRAATQDTPARRPQSISELVNLIDREHQAIPVEPLERATTLLERANGGNTGAADAFLTLLTDHTGDYDLYVGSLTELTARQAGPALVRNLPQAQNILRALTEHVDGGDARWVQFPEASRVTIWLYEIAAHAASVQQWDLLEEAMQAMCTWDGAWDQWNAQGKIGPWLASLKGDAAATVGAVLRDYPSSASHFSHLADDRTSDPHIRQAVRQH